MFSLKNISHRYTKRQEIGVKWHRAQVTHHRNSIRRQTAEAIGTSGTRTRLVYSQDTEKSWPGGDALPACSSLVTLEVLAEQRGEPEPETNGLWHSSTCLRSGLTGTEAASTTLFHGFLILVIQDLHLMMGKCSSSVQKRNPSNYPEFNSFKPEDCTLVLHKASVVCSSVTDQVTELLCNWAVTAWHFLALSLCLLQHHSQIFLLFTAKMSNAWKAH